MRRLLAGMFLIALSMGVAGIALPLYAWDLGASYTEIGMLGVTYVIFNSLFSIPVGRMGDRRGRKLLIVLGFFLTAFVIALYPLFSAVAWLLILRILQGAAEASIWVNTPSAVVDLSQRSGRGRAMGTYGTSWAIGFGTGPLIGGALYAFVGAGQTFLLGALLGFLATAIVIGMPETKPRVWNKKLKQKLKLGSLWPVCGVGFIYVGIASIIFILFPVYATKTLGMTALGAGLLITLFSGTRALLFIPMGGLSDRIGHRPVILVGLMGLALGSAGISLISGYLALAVVIAFMAIAGGAVYPAMMSVVSKVGEGRSLGHVLGIFNAIVILGWGFFPGIGGALADAYEPTSPYLMYALVAIVSTVLVWKLLPKK